MLMPITHPIDYTANHALRPVERAKDVPLTAPAQTQAHQDRHDPRIHSAPASVKPFTRTPQFWLAVGVAVIGCLLATVAQPALIAAPLSAWVLPVGYFTAILGALALVVFWIVYRAR